MPIEAEHAAEESEENGLDSYMQGYEAGAWSALVAAEHQGEKEEWHSWAESSYALGSSWYGAEAWSASSEQSTAEDHETDTASDEREICMMHSMMNEIAEAKAAGLDTTAQRVALVTMRQVRSNFRNARRSWLRRQRQVSTDQSERWRQSGQASACCITTWC